MDGSMSQSAAYADESTSRWNARTVATNRSPSSPKHSGTHTKWVYWSLGERSARSRARSSASLASRAACREGATTRMDPGGGGSIPDGSALVDEPGSATDASWSRLSWARASGSWRVTCRARSASAETSAVHDPPACCVNPSSRSVEAPRPCRGPSSSSSSSFSSSSSSGRAARLRHSASFRARARSSVSPMEPLCFRNLLPPTSTMSAKMTSPIATDRVRRRCAACDFIETGSRRDV